MGGQQTSKALPFQFFPNDMKEWSYHRTANKPKIFLDSTGPSELRGEPVSSVYGFLKTMILFFPIAQEYEKSPKRLFVKFIKELMSRFTGGGRSFILIVENDLTLSDSLRRGLHKYAAKGGNTIQIVPISYPNRMLSIWARDCMWARTKSINKDQLEIEFIQPKEQIRNQDIAKVLRSALEPLSVGRQPAWLLEHTHSPFSFEGGNVLVGDVILMGAHGMGRNNYFSAEELACWWGKPVVLFDLDCSEFERFWRNQYQTKDGFFCNFLGASSRQPLFHIDLFISLAGHNDKGEEVYVVGEPACGFPLDNCPDDVREHIDYIIDTSRASINALVEQLKEQLSYLGRSCEIIRNPLNLIYYDSFDKKKNTKTRHFVFATSNNVLTEVYPNPENPNECIKRVVLPSYGQDSDYSDQLSDYNALPYGNWKYMNAYDQANKKIWQDLGFEVILLERNFHSFVKDLGALNCLVNCIERNY